MNLTRMIGRTLPPLVADALRPYVDLALGRNVLKYAADGWDTPIASTATHNYDAPPLVNFERTYWAPLIDAMRADRGGAMAGLGEHVQDRINYAYVLLRIAQGRTRLRVLDYGGGLGYYYWIGRMFAPDIVVEHHCKEFPGIAAAGRELTPEIHWHSDDQCLDESYDLVLMAAVLQYVPQWRELLRRAAHAAPFVYIRDVPVVDHAKTFVALQRHEGIWMLHQQINVPELVSSLADTGLCIARDFPATDHPRIIGAPEQPHFGSWLLKRLDTPS